jgi:hypothetical protein
MPRASHIQKAERINLARTLLQLYQAKCGGPIGAGMLASPGPVSTLP